MLDTWLTAALLKAVKPGARILFIGDADQLPPVGAGNVLRDIISSEKFATVRLNEIFRQAEMSLIVTNAHAVNSGRMPALGVRDNDFFFLPRATDASAAATIVDLYKNRLPRSYGDGALSDIQVISPSTRGEAGTENLNILLQQALNPPAPEKDERGTATRPFGPVIGSCRYAITMSSNGSAAAPAAWVCSTATSE